MQKLLTLFVNQFIRNGMENEMLHLEKKVNQVEFDNYKLF